MSPHSQVARRQVEIIERAGSPPPAGRQVRPPGSVSFQSEDRGCLMKGTRSTARASSTLTTLAAECGTRLDLEARGPDAEAAVEALAELVLARFHETEEGHDRGLPSSDIDRVECGLTPSGVALVDRPLRASRAPLCRPPESTDPIWPRPPNVLDDANPSRDRRQPWHRHRSGPGLGPESGLRPHAALGLRPNASPPSLIGSTRALELRPRLDAEEADELEAREGGSARSMPTSWPPTPG